MANALTLARIALIIPFVALFLANAPWNMTAAFAVFVLASLTDFADGRVARARGETSALGAAIDPIADKLLIAAALVLLIRNGVIGGASIIAALAILLREVLVSGLREAVAAQNASLAVTGLAKWKTAAQIIAVGLLLASAPQGILSAEFRPFGVGALWLAAILTIWTGGAYCRAAVQILNKRQSD